MRLKYPFWLLLNICAVLALNLVMKRTIFSMGVEDGFYQQVASETSFTGGPLAFVHLARFAVVLPFLMVYQAGLPPVVESTVALLYVLPILLAKGPTGRHHWAQPLLFYAIFPFGYRAVLCMCGIGYLFLHDHVRRNLPLFALSALLANLSSGVVMAWLFIVLWRHGGKLARHPALLVVTGVLSTGFVISILQKREFFDTDSAVDTVVPIVSENMIINSFARNTIIVSWYYGNYLRAVCYTLLFLLAVFLLVYVVLNKFRYADYLGFWLASIPMFFLEGLGPVSFCFAYALFMMFVFRRPRPALAAPAPAVP